MNTKIRRKAKNKFQKYFFMLMIYTVFGKTIENLRKRRNVKVVQQKGE